MNDKLYMIVFDVSDDRLSPRRLLNFVEGSPNIHHWWNHLPALFLVETDLDARQLSKSLQDVLRRVSFVVMEVNPGNSSGWLPEDAAEWIERRQASKHTLQPVSTH